MFEDWSLAPMILYQAKTISYINRPYYFYDIHEEGSAMRSQTTKRHYDCVLGDLDHINYFKSLNVTEYDSKLKMYLSADYFKCSRCYTGSKEDKALLKDAYQKVKVIIPGFKTFCLYHFAGIIHLMSRIKHFIK